MSVEEAELPKFHELFVPVLRALQLGEVRPSREVIDALAQDLALSEEQRNSKIPSGQRRFDNRVNWALSYLFQSRAVTKHGRGQYQITQRGQDLLKAHPGGFKQDTLEEFEEYREFRERTRQGKAQPAPDISDQAPLEQMEEAVAALHADVAAELVQRLQNMSPVFLEKAVLRLLTAMGYGASDDAALHMGGPGDGGFDGVINQDQLGIGRIYLQAKRYADDNVIGRPSIQGFVGALHHAGAAGGVFITTSRFSAEAREFARSITPRVVMIDGERLGALMIEYGIGVQDRQHYRVVEADDDFFEEA